ncbi:NUDIX hydrolase [Streptomyces sp. NPDC087270]|uniref:NUDIX hydrolase n=1 Tax=Streptomyces sp. NPDC087270 TaxID=3365774 RepID=UPI0038140394
MVVARDAEGLVAVLSARLLEHGGDCLFLPAGRREPGESPEDWARRELREEPGVAATVRRSLGSFALVLSSSARVHPYEAVARG